MSSILLALQADVRRYMNYTVNAHIWPFHTSSPQDVADGEGWIHYIGLSPAIPGPEMNFFPKFIRVLIHEQAQIDFEKICMDHPLFDRSASHLEVRVGSQAEFFGNEAAANHGFDMREDVD